MNDPIIAIIGSIKGIKKLQKNNCKNCVNKIANIAPTAAPLDTPINPGSTRGFLNKPCKIAPEVPRASPTSAPRITLGSLIFNKTISLISCTSWLDKKLNCCKKIISTSYIDILTGP